jgi:hypothetical protein
MTEIPCFARNFATGIRTVARFRLFLTNKKRQRSVHHFGYLPLLIFNRGF